MKIILGIFGPSFKKLQKEHQASGYYEVPGIPGFERYPKEVQLKINTKHVKAGLDLTICDLIKYNIIEATEIIFDMTYVYAPFTTEAITLRELYFIYNHGFINKTTFYVSGKEIDKQIVLDLLTLPENKENTTKYHFALYDKINHRTIFQSHFNEN